MPTQPTTDKAQSNSTAQIMRANPLSRKEWREAGDEYAHGYRLSFAKAQEGSK